MVLVLAPQPFSIVTPSSMHFSVSVALSTLATASLVPAPALAFPVQGGATPTLKEHYDTGYPSSPAFGSGDLSRGTAAVTRPGALPDFFGIRGTQLVRMSEAGLFNSFERIDPGVSTSDVAELRGGGASTGTSGVVHVGSSGLRWSQVDGVTNTVVTSTISASETAGIQLVCGQVVGDANLDVVVLDADRSTFRVYTGTSTGFDPVPATFALAGRTVADFDLSRLYASNANADLIVAVQDGFEAYRIQAGVQPLLLMSRTNPAYTLNQVETLRDHAGLGLDGFAFLTRLGTNGLWALVAGTGDTYQPATLLDSGLEVVGMSAGRIDDNTLVAPSTAPDPDDLVLSFTDASQIRTYLNQGLASTAAFGLGSTQEIVIDTGLTGTNATNYPTVRDLDGNRRADVMFANLEDGTLDLRVIYDVDSVPFASLVDPNFDWDPLSGSWAFQAQGGGDSTCTAFVKAPDLPTQTSLASVMFHQPGAGSPFGGTAVGYCPGAVPATPLASADSYEVILDFTEGTWPTTGNQFFVLRVNTEDPLDNGRQPTILIAFETNVLPGSATILGQLPNNAALNPYITSRQGATATPLNANVLGSEIVVAKLPVKRITPPQPPVLPNTTGCP